MNMLSTKVKVVNEKRVDEADVLCTDELYSASEGLYHLVDSDYYVLVLESERGRNTVVGIETDYTGLIEKFDPDVWDHDSDFVRVDKDVKLRLTIKNVKPF
jgi:hypothetical protein